jgi:hypothetical protein
MLAGQAERHGWLGQEQPVEDPQHGRWRDVVLVERRAADR